MQVVVCEPRWLSHVLLVVLVVLVTHYAETVIPI